MAANLTPEQLQKRRNVNGKILKFGCLPIVILFLIIIGLTIFYTPDFEKSDNLMEELSNCTERSEFDAKTIDIEHFIKETDNDSIKQALTNLLTNKEKLWQQISIKKQFSARNGSHKNLVEYVKNNMKDPSSFEHVNTEYQVNTDSTITVHMKYRGKNSFNATITEEIWAKADLDGKIVKILQ